MNHRRFGGTSRSAGNGVGEEILIECVMKKGILMNYVPSKIRTIPYHYLRTPYMVLGMIDDSYRIQDST